LALKLDMPHDIPANWFNAEAAVVQPITGPTIFTALQAPSVEVQKILSDTGQLQTKYPEFDVYQLYARVGSFPPPEGVFESLIYKGSQSPHRATPGSAVQWITNWQIAQSAAQPRLKMFLHVLNDKDEVIVGDDREDLNFSTLSPGTSFWQISQLTLPGDLPPGQYQIEVGWYNPETGERLKRDGGSDRLLLAPLEVISP